MNSKSVLTWALVLLAPLAIGCHNDDDDDDGGSSPLLPPSGEVALPTLSGVVRKAVLGELPQPVSGLLVTMDPGGLNERTLRTDTRGRFIFPNVAAGLTRVMVDGMSAPGSELASAGADVIIAGQGTSFFPPVVLTDLLAPQTAIGTADIDPLNPGIVLSDVDVFGANPQVGALLPAGTLIEIGSTPAQGTVNIAVAEIPGFQLDIPGPPAGTDATSYVLVSPQDASFDIDPQNPQVLGITVLMPNRRNFSDGAVQIWHWNEGTASWDSVQTTDLIGGVVEITSAPTGGIYAATKPADPVCTTTLTGRAITVSGSPLDGVLVLAGTGDSAITAGDGTFTINNVPAYDYDQLPACAPTPLRLDYLTNIIEGSQFRVDAASTVPGGVTDLGDSLFNRPVTGHVSGLTLDNGTGTATLIDIRGPVNRMRMSEPDGSFFVTGLPAGAYTAETTFPGETEPNSISFDIQSASITTVELERTQN